MSKKFENPELTQINRQAYLAYRDSGNFIVYDGPNADVLIRQLPCPEVYFDNRVHVLVDKRWQSLYDNVIENGTLKPSLHTMKSISLNDYFPNLKSFIAHYNLYNIPEKDCFYFFYEDWRFVIYHYDLFREESINSDLLHSSGKLILNPEPCSLVHCGDFYETDFRMINFYTAADILKSHSINFRFNPESQCFILDYKTNCCGPLLENIDVRIVKQDSLGYLLSQHIDNWRQYMKDAYDDDMDPELAAAYDHQIESILLKND